MGHENVAWKAICSKCILILDDNFQRSFPLKWYLKKVKKEEGLELRRKKYDGHRILDAFFAEGQNLHIDIKSTQGPTFKSLVHYWLVEANSNALSQIGEEWP